MTEELKTKMLNIQRRFQKNYKHDIDYDFDTLCKKENENKGYFWIVRKNGTHLCEINDIEEIKMYITYFTENKDYSARYYEIRNNEIMKYKGE